MQTFTALLITSILVQKFSGLFGQSSDEDADSMPQPFNLTKNDAPPNKFLRNVLKVLQPEDVNFYLYTRSNPKVAQELHTNDVESVQSSLFNRHNPTRIIIHGWMSGSEYEVNTLIRDAYLSTGPHNIIVVNWKTMSTGLYPTVAMAVPYIGGKLAAFIDFMAQHDFVKPENLTLIGHSMGAHIAGFAAKYMKSGKIHTIIALDPAEPKFPYNEPNKRLNDEDAFYVESIQTNGAVSGYVRPLGKATFYPNGGQTQLGCGFDPTGSCAHFRSYRFFAEAIEINGFPSVNCSNYKEAVAKKCGSKFSETVRMGAPSNADHASGVFYVPCRPTKPYAVEFGKGEVPNKVKRFIM